MVLWADFCNSRVSRVDVHLSLSVKIFAFTWLTNLIKKSAHLVHECGQSKQLLFNVFGSTDSRTAFYLFDNVEIGYLQGNSTHSPEPKLFGFGKTVSQNINRGRELNYYFTKTNYLPTIFDKCCLP